MADEAAQTEAPKKGPNKMVIVGGALVVMLIEAVAVYFIIGMTSAAGVKAAEVGLDTADEDDPDRMVEVALIDDRFFNATTGRPYVFNVRIVLKVKQKNMERVQADMERRAAEILERVGQAIGSAQHRHLMFEPGRETIKAKLEAVMREVFGEVSGEPRVAEVLVPKLDGGPLDL